MNAFDALAGWKLKLTLGAILVAVFVGWTAYWVDQGSKAQAKRDAPVFAAYEVRIARLLDLLKTADDKLAESNAKVDQLKADADARERTAAAALKAARTQADRYRLRASQIAAARPVGDQCVASRDVIVEVLREDRQ